MASMASSTTQKSHVWVTPGSNLTDHHTCKNQDWPSFLHQLRWTLRWAVGSTMSPYLFHNLLPQKIMACITVHKGTRFTHTTYKNVKFLQLMIPPCSFTHSNPTNSGNCTDYWFGQEFSPALTARLCFPGLAMGCGLLPWPTHHRGWHSPAQPQNSFQQPQAQSDSCEICILAPNFLQLQH